MDQHIFNHRRGTAVAKRVLVGAAFATALTAPDAFAAAGPQGIRAGHNITVFHNIDMVAVFGHGVGETTQVDVLRGPHRIGTARGPAVDTPDGGAVEVNHGPAGAAQPGDCFEGATPDIRPGDRVLVTNPGGSAGVDEAIVDNITIDSRTQVARDAVTGGPPQFTPEVPAVPPVLDPITGAVITPGTPAIPPQPLPTRQEVWVEGVAFEMNADGTQGAAVPLADLDSAGFIDLPNDNQLRMAPNTVVAGATAGSYIAKYFDANPAVNGSGFNIERNRNNQSDANIFAALMDSDGHAMGYGHVAPLPPVAMLVDGLTEQTSTAPGCEAAPKLASSAATTSVDTLNIANTGPTAADPVLSVGGFAAAGVGSADVVLSDGTASVTRSATLSGGTGQQGLTADFTKADLAGLAQGTLSARLSVAGAPVGATKRVVHDTVAPTFAVNLAEGTHVGPQGLIVQSPSDPVTYRVDGAAASAYTGTPIPLDVGSHTVVLRSEDSAGNVTERTLQYVIGAIPASAGNQPAAAGGSTAVGTTAAPLAGLAANAGTPQAAASLAAPAPAATLLTQNRRLAGAAARRSGLSVRFSAPAGSRSAAVKVYRSKNGVLTLVRKRSARVKGGANRVVLASPALRRKLTAGLYLIRITLEGSDGRSGSPTEMFVRVLR